MTGRRLAGAVGLAVLLVVAGGPAAAETLLPDEPTGGFPTSRYEVWYADGGFFDVGSRVLGLLTEVAFGAVRMLVSAAVWVITWAYSFRFAPALARPAGRLAAGYEHELVGPLELRYLVLFCAVAYAGWQVLRNRAARGVGELLVSMIILAAGGGLLAAPAGALDTGVEIAAGLSAAVLEIATDRPGRADAGAVDAAAAVQPLTDGLREAFIAQPHDLLNWGSALPAACAGAREEALRTGPHGTAEPPRELMRAAGPECDGLAEFNARPSVERLMGALLVLCAALVVLLLMLLVACTVVVAQLVAVVLVAVAPFAVTLGALPGGGRQLLWRWCAAGLRCVAVIVAMAAVLAFMLVTATVLLEDSGATLRERLAILVLSTIAMVVLRRRVLTGTQSLVNRIDRRLEGARIGGAHGGGWMRPADTGGLSGLGAAAVVREAEHDVRGLGRNRAVAWARSQRAYRAHAAGAARHHARSSAASRHGRGASAGARDGRGGLG